MNRLLNKPGSEFSGNSFLLSALDAGYRPVVLAG